MPRFSRLLTILVLFRLPALSKKREDYATDLEQFEDLVRQMDEHKEALEQKVKERTAELATANEEVESKMRSIAALKERIQEQELSIEDVRKMESERLRAKESLERASALRQQCKEELWETESELTKIIEEFDAVVDDYNNKLSELLQVLEDIGHAANFKMRVKKQHLHSGDQALLLGVDLYADVRPFLSHQKSESLDQMTRLRRELQEALDHLEASEEAFTEALDKLKVSRNFASSPDCRICFSCIVSSIQIVEDKKTKCEETLNREREQQEAALAVRLREVTSIDDKIESLRDPAALEEQIARYQRQCTQLEALQMKHEEENLSQKRAVQNEINAALMAVTDHKDYVQKKFAELQQHILKKKASLGKVSVPSSVNLEK